MALLNARMKRTFVMLSAFIAACWIVALATALGVRVHQRIEWMAGEGGPYLECTYLGALGPLKRRFFYDTSPESSRLVPRGREACPLLLKTTE